MLAFGDPARRVELNAAQRCEACIQHNRICWIEEETHGYLVCFSQKEPCLFTRTVTRTATKSEF